MIPLSTTTISVLRIKTAGVYDEPYGDAGPETRDIAEEAVPAVIDAPGGDTQIAGGVQAIGTFRLICDPADITFRDWIRDDLTGRIYRIRWVHTYPGDHVEAGLESVEGEA